MEDILISILESVGYEAYRQGASLMVINTRTFLYILE